jgi:hypothetical protein
MRKGKVLKSREKSNSKNNKKLRKNKSVSLQRDSSLSKKNKKKKNLDKNFWQNRLPNYQGCMIKSSEQSEISINLWITEELED